MSTELATIAQPQSFVALTPGDVPQAQQGIAVWCKAKIVELSHELREQRQNLAQAKAAKWKHRPWLTQISRTKRRMIYYTKIKAAVEAGYLIVPNFDVEVMAVRVQRYAPPSTIAGYKSSDLTDARPELLAPGAGRYVDDKQLFEDLSHDVPDTTKQSGKRRIESYRATNYGLPDFPVTAVKPIILEATERAMGLRIFDRIGVVTGRKKDPVVIGEIIDPSARLDWSLSSQKRVSFFIAWWLNTEDL